jgi:hypothetical protein
MVSRAIDYRLNWVRRNKDRIFCGAPKNKSNENHVGELDEEESSNSEASYLPSSFHGSPKHLKSLAQNALTVVSEFGKPDLFITLTCNPLWEEITSQLLAGQSAFDRPDITCQVFKNKLDAILHNLKAGKYFGNNDVQYLMKVIEYQHRGLPHAHIVVKFTDGFVPNFKDDPDGVVAWIDTQISAQLPEFGESPTEEEKEAKLLVITHMTHKCAVAVNGCKRCSEELCRRGYETNRLLEKTEFGENMFPRYKRRKEGDLKIVPHNIKLLMDWKGSVVLSYSLIIPNNMIPFRPRQCGVCWLFAMHPVSVQVPLQRL